MPFWSDSRMSPKLSYRWLLDIGGGPGTSIANYTVRSFQKPSFTVGVSEYLNINDLAYKPGIVSWTPIDVTLVDPENTFENNSKILYRIIQESGYVKDPRNAEQFPASAIVKKRNSSLLGGGGAYGGLITFTQIDSHGDAVETWTLWNPFISSINFGQANYASDELMTISVQIYYDFADFRLAHE